MQHEKVYNMKIGNTPKRLAIPFKIGNIPLMIGDIFLKIGDIPLKIGDTPFSIDDILLATVRVSS